MTNPKVSVCIPVYNTEKFLRRCLDSIINQDFDNIEIIVVNDASPDNSNEILNEYALKDKRLIIIENAENKGPMFSRKEGYERAGGDYLMFVDSDDYLEPGAIRKLYKKITDDKAEIVVSGYNYYPNEGAITKHISQLRYGQSKEGAFKALLQNELPHNMWANLYDSRLFRDYKYTCLPNQTNGEDFLLFYEIIGNVTKIVALGEATYAYCQNSQSATQVKLSERKLLDLLNVNLLWYEKMSKLGLFEHEIQKFFFNLILQKYLSIHNNSIITSKLKDISELFYLKNLVHRLGLIKGSILYNYYNDTCLVTIINFMNRLRKKFS